ncbi:hypothetical protein ARMSODRAFT_470472 [Armillaria solidipes]|uniref:Uncharacterized protein n=1 Tax=Armillaria solidipes TaxID=1076256 RepID=A0A2H3B648_9AGAR|nr:hypothetical protein ARMSODRAFT_470472 [Armillaria solidipes]
MNMEISKSITGCSSIPEAAMTVPWEQVKAYSDMLEGLETDASESEHLNHDPLRAQIYEVNSDDRIDDNVAQGAYVGSLSYESSAITPISRVSLVVYILGGIVTVLVDSPLLRVFLVLGLFIYSWSMEYLRCAYNCRTFSAST